MATAAEKRRAKARLEMRQEIVETARRMVEAEGLANLSLRAIARDLGYSPASLYEYFPSKQAIAKTLYLEGTDGLAGRMHQSLAALPPDTPPIEAKKALGRAYRAFALEHRELFLLTFGSGESYSSLSEQMDAGNNGYEALLTTVRLGIEQGDFAPLPADIVALTSWAAVHGFVMLELAGMFDHNDPNCEPAPADQPSPDEIFEMHLDLIDLGVRRR